MPADRERRATLHSIHPVHPIHCGCDDCHPTDLWQIGAALAAVAIVCGAVISLILHLS